MLRNAALEEKRMVEERDYMIKLRDQAGERYPTVVGRGS
jgi:hypothetical protein